MVDVDVDEVESSGRRRRKTSEDEWPLGRIRRGQPIVTIYIDNYSYIFYSLQYYNRGTIDQFNSSIFILFHILFFSLFTWIVSASVRVKRENYNSYTRQGKDNYYTLIILCVLCVLCVLHTTHSSCLPPRSPSSAISCSHQPRYQQSCHCKSSQSFSQNA